RLAAQEPVPGALKQSFEAFDSFHEIGHLVNDDDGRRVGGQRIGQHLERAIPPGRPDLGHDRTAGKRRAGHVVTELGELGVGGSASGHVEERGDVSAAHELLGERRLPYPSPASHQQAAPRPGRPDLVSDLIEQPGQAGELVVTPNEVTHGTPHVGYIKDTNIDVSILGSTMSSAKDRRRVTGVKHLRYTHLTGYAGKI